jgi:hypothetical protein
MIDSLKLGGGDSLDFDAFCALFAGNLEKKHSMLSLLSSKSASPPEPDYSEF